jgi:hypothetical protein
MSEAEFISIIASALLSGAVATALSLYIQNKRAIRARKADCLRRVVGLRSAPPNKEWLAAMNEIVVTFNTSSAVIKSLAVFERDIRATGGHKNELLIDLIKEMMRDLDLSRDGIDDEFLLRPFGSAN